MNKQFKTIFKVLAIISLAIIQITLIPYFGILGLWPNLIFLLSLTLILIGAKQEAYLAASLGGLILDLASPLFFGFYTLVLFGIVAIVQLLVDKFLGEVTVFIQVLVLILATVIFNMIFCLTAHQFQITTFSINVLYSLILGLIMFRVLNTWLYRR